MLGLAMHRFDSDDFHQCILGRNGQRTDISSSYLDLHRKTRGKAAAPFRSVAD